MTKTKIILIIAVVLIAFTVPVLAAEEGIQKFSTGDIIQRKIPPPNGAYWKVIKYNETAGKYFLEPVRPGPDYPYWLPMGGRIWMVRQFIDVRFVWKGTCGKPLVV